MDGCDVYSDAIDAELADEVKELLTGCEYGAKPLAEALRESLKPQILELAEYIEKNV